MTAEAGDAAALRHASSTEAAPGVAVACSDEPDTFIAVRPVRLVEQLAADFAGIGPADQLDRLFRLLGLLFRIEGREVLVGLRDDYHGFNPNLPAGAGDLDQSDATYERLMRRLHGVLTQANFTPIPDEQLTKALAASAEVDVRLEVPQPHYRNVVFYGRGRREEMVTRSRFLGLVTRTFPATRLRHVVVAIRFRNDMPRPRRWVPLAGRNPNPQIGPGKAVIKLFSDVAEADLNMLYPGARAVMRIRDKLMLGLPAIAGGVPVLLNILPALSVLFVLAATYLGFRAATAVPEDEMAQALAAMSALAGLGGFCMRQWMKFERQVLKYQTALSDNLYYRNVCNNAAVFDFLIGTAEDQEFKEAALAYVHLAAAAGPMTGRALKRTIEDWLMRAFNAEVRFDLSDALDKLRRLGLLNGDPDTGLTVPPLAEAVSVLQGHWSTTVDSDTR